MKKNNNTRLRPRPLAIAITLSCSFSAHAGGSFMGLGTLGGTESAAYDVSTDGSVVVGYSDLTGDNLSHAFRWTATGGMQDLGTLGNNKFGGGNSFANAVSADGSVVVGSSNVGVGIDYEAFRWTAADGMGSLGTLPGGTWSWANGVSANGAVIVGAGNGADGATHAVRWDNGVITDLASGGELASWANAVSSNGNVMAGWRNAGPGPHATLWKNGAPVDLGTLGGAQSYASDLSADGKVVVGSSEIAGGGMRAFRYVDGAQPMVSLGTLGEDSGAIGVSADGQVVVGWSRAAAGAPAQAIRWSEASGLQAVTAWLSQAGVAMPAGWHLIDAYATNADGSVVVGVGRNASNNDEAWLARVSPIGSGLLLDMNAFNRSVSEAGARAAQGGIDLPNLALFGAHHRSLLDSGLARTRNGTCAWATADGARYDASGTNMGLAEAGVCKDAGSARFGIGLGQAWARQGWSLGGGAKYRGQYLIAEAANAFANGMEGSVTAYYGRFSTDLRRHYQNGASIDSSSGNPDASAAAIRARLDWNDLARLGRFSLSPYAAYTRMETRLDAYTESGGGFPAAFDATKWTSEDLRVGLAARTALTPATSLRLAGEYVHRLQDSTDGVKGQVLGLWSVSLPGEKVKSDWARLTLDLDHRLSDKSLVTLGMNAGTAGGDPTWGLSVGWRGNF